MLIYEKENIFSIDNTEIIKYFYEILYSLSVLQSIDTLVFHNGQ